MKSCKNGECAVENKVREHKQRHTHEHEETNMKAAIIRAVISFALLVAGLLFSAFKVQFFDNRWVELAWYLAAYLPVAVPVIREAWEATLKKDIFSEFTLMSIATIGAFFIGEYPEGVAVMLFYCVGEIFQNASVDKAKRNISALLDVRPESANVIRNGRIENVHPETIKVGETIEVKVGERVPLDGVLVSDAAAFNTSALTGESAPRSLKKGDEVYAGMIADDIVNRIEVTKPFNQSALARVLELVEDASEHKAPAEKFITRFSRIYTPIVVMAALLIVSLPWVWSLISPDFVYVFSQWLYRGLVFLVISCPCALVISVPLSYFGGIGAASRKGILFKGGNYLEAMTRVNTVVMDKTGTLTQGVFTVRETVPAGGITKEGLLQAVASVETQSTHPIAKAIIAYAADNGIAFPEPRNTKEIPGYGLAAEVGGKQVLAGNAKLLAKNGIGYPAEVENIPETIVLCAIDGKYAGYVIVADAPKEDAKTAIDELHRLGINNIIMLSGDKQAIVSKLAAELGIEKAYGNLLPEDKVRHLEDIKSGTNNTIVSAFVGDGINDAPVLALSDIGIAMGGLGSDVAIETANVIIQNDQPSHIPTAIKIGRMTHKIVIENIILALGVKGIVLILGAFGVATLWEAVFADVGVSLLAILNSLRIMRKKY